MKRIPSSLGQNPATSAPIYLELKYQLSGSGKRWKNVKELSGSNGFLLPPPKTGLGMASQSTNIDEMSIFSVPSVSDTARSIAGDSLFYGISSLLNEEGQPDYVAGGVNVPNDLSFLRFRGFKKRVYQFGIQLFAYNSQDAQSIQEFVTTMHTIAAPLASGGAGKQKLFVPAMFQPRIITSGGNEAKGFLVNPRPCTLMNFSSSAGKYTSTIGGNPAIMSISIALAEIEPVVNHDGTIRSQFEIFGK